MCILFFRMKFVRTIVSPGPFGKDVDFNEFIRLIQRTTNVKFVINQKNIIIEEEEKAGSTVILPALFK